MNELPSGTVTFLFTDLEGSTRLWEEHPDAMQGALARHDEILRDAIVAHDGHIVKMTGDGAHAAFSDATAAVHAAHDAQVAFAAETWGSTGPLSVRMGLHTGPAEARDGDYFGTAVNRAARLMSVAHGGQVIVSLTTEELLRDSMPDGVAFLDLGEHRLRDLARAERVFQLCAGGLLAEFPPLRTLDAYAGNLPTQLTSFVGRDEELGTVATMVRDARLVTLTGVGGVGKTRLATQVAAELLPEFPDGAWLVELAAASDPETMVQVMAATLGVQPRAGASLEASIVEFLRAKRALVVLDNCEHLLDAAAGFAESVLRACDKIRLLATSREGLAVAGEHVRPLRSLSTSSAETLFEERAQAVVPEFVVDVTNVAAVAEVCRRLDGIPLAIELAAARVAAMSPEEIAGLLDERFRLLTGGRRTAVERHQTLRAMVDWSYSLLDATERLVFDRLGVFSGSFDAAAASAIVAGQGVEPWDVRDALASLVARSMLVAERGESGITRYSMLETLRKYARERLEESGHADVWRRRHAEHYLGVAEEIAAALIGPDEFNARQRFDAELDNFRAAFTWALDRDDPEDVELGVGLVATLAIQSSTHVVSGIGLWAEQAVLYAQHSTPARRFAVEAAAAWTLVTLHADPVGAAALARDALRDGVPPDTSAAGLAHVALGMAYQISGEWDLLFAAMDEGERALDAIGAHDYHRCSLLGAASNFLATSGDMAAARRKAEQALPPARRLRNPSALALVLFSLAFAAWEDDPDVALAAAEESIALTRAGATQGAFGPVLVIAARLRAREGDRIGALEGSREAILHSHGVGDMNNLPYCLHDVVQTFAALAEMTVAAEIIGALDDGPLRSMSFVFLANERARRERARATARASLGDAGYEAACARGAAMSNEEIALLAIATLDRLLAETDDG